MMRTCCMLAAGLLLGSVASAESESVSQQQARATMRRVISFYQTSVGYEGAYLWKYAADLSAQEGEGSASRTSGWTQPPDTPAVGQCYLDAWHLSQDDFCLAAAVEAAEALIKAQLVSGGWSSHFDLSCRTYRYRFNGDPKGRNSTTFDDNKTQSAMMLLMRVDEALKFENVDVHECVEYGLNHILKAQYPNGAWPQQFSAPAPADESWVAKASFPTTWSRTFPKQKYTQFYTLNDNNMSRIIDMLMEAHRIYGVEAYKAAAVRTADFFLLAQMPDPQPGWAQQYSHDMHPVWARKFEPPAITGGESQSVIRSLIDVYRFTGEDRFLKPVPAAIAYYRESTLPDGRLARFYELKSNRPLYFTKEYELTYSDSNVPTHYSFKVRSGLDALERRYQRALKHSSDEPNNSASSLSPVRWTKQAEEQALKVIESLDSRGAWVERGKMRHTEKEIAIISMRTLIQNLKVLARFVGAPP